MSGGCRERPHSAPPLPGAAPSPPRHDAGYLADAGSDRTQHRPCAGRRPPLPDTTRDVWRMQGAVALSPTLARGGVLPSPTRRGMSGGCRERPHSAPPAPPLTAAPFGNGTARIPAPRTSCIRAGSTVGSPRIRPAPRAHSACRPRTIRAVHSPSLAERALHASSTDWPSTTRPSLLCPHRP